MQLKQQVSEMKDSKQWQGKENRDVWALSSGFPSLQKKGGVAMGDGGLRTVETGQGC